MRTYLTVAKYKDEKAFLLIGDDFKEIESITQRKKPNEKTYSVKLHGIDDTRFLMPTWGAVYINGESKKIIPLQPYIPEYGYKKIRNIQLSYFRHLNYAPYIQTHL